MTSLSPRPFSTLGLKPFLWLEADDYKAIQKRYFQLSREFHPDRMGHLSDNERQMLEATSAKINLDYSKLKDSQKLAESVVSGAHLSSLNVDLSKSAKSSVPPQLAAEYFELQEVWEENGFDSVESQKSGQIFLAKVRGLKEQSESELTVQLKEFPFQGFGDASAPWTESDLKSLSAVLQQLRYFNSFMKDFESRFGQNAHSN